MAESKGSAPESSSQRGLFGNLVNLVSGLGALLTVLSVVSFFFYVLDIKSISSIVDVFRHAANPKLDPWPTLSAELYFYKQAGYYLDWLNFPVLTIIRRICYPYSQLVDLTLLRLWGVANIFIPLFILLALGYTSGRVRGNEKDAAFEHKSPTLVYTLLPFRFVGYSLVGLFLALPFGSEIPLIGYLPIYSTFTFLGWSFSIWYSSPVILLVLMAVPGIFISYLISSHFTFEV